MFEYFLMNDLIKIKGQTFGFGEYVKNAGSLAPLPDVQI